MADFLTQLIARSLDEAPRLQRRQPARFETRARDQQPLPEIAVEQTAAMPMRERPAPPPHRVPPTAALPQPALGEPATLPQAVPPQPSPLARPAAAPQERLAERSMERLQETAPRPERVIHHTAETRQEHTHTEVRQTLVEQHRIIERPAPVPAAARPRLDHTIIEQRAATPAKSPAQGAPENIPARPPAAAKPSPTLPQRVEKMETARQPAPGIEPAPVITVSIGRVEIRTAQPTASAPRTPRAAAPKLGLDEYLRRRSGGVQ